VRNLLGITVAVAVVFTLADTSSAEQPKGFKCNVEGLGGASEDTLKAHCARQEERWNKSREEAEARQIQEQEKEEQRRRIQQELAAMYEKRERELEKREEEDNPKITEAKAAEARGDDETAFRLWDEIGGIEAPNHIAAKNRVSNRMRQKAAEKARQVEQEAEEKRVVEQQQKAEQARKVAEKAGQVEQEAKKKRVAEQQRLKDAIVAEFNRFLKARYDPNDVVAQVLNYSTLGQDEAVSYKEESRKEGTFWYAKSKCVYAKASVGELDDTGVFKFNSEAMVIDLNKIDPRTVKIGETVTRMFSFPYVQIGDTLILRAGLLLLDKDRLQRGWSLIFSKYCKGAKKAF
jgi:hypothetical protein